MTNLLVKLFIKDYKNIKNENVRTKYGELGSLVGISSNVILFIIKFLVGVLINSVAIMADSFNNLSDSLSSIITLVGFKLGAKPADEEHPFGHGRMEYISGLVVSFIIILIGFEFLRASFFKIIKETLSPLLGEAIDNELAEKIKSIAISYDGVIGVHDILVHNYGPNKSIASLHVEVPSNIDITKSHETIDLIEKHIQKELNIFLTIHMDPVNVNDERIQTILDTIKNVFKNYDDELDTHDHRLVDGQNRINFIFDLVIPYNFSKEKETKLISDIKSNVSALDKRYKCIINIEKSFINK